MKHIKTLITITAAALLIISISTGAAAADNVTNSSTEQLLSYRMAEMAGQLSLPCHPMTEQYQQDFDAWYNYYKSLQEPNVGKTLRTKIYDHLMDSSLSWDAKQALIRPLMGCDYRLITYLDGTKRIIHEDGTVTYDLGAGDWWAKSFGGGIEKHPLLQIQAEGDVLYQIYLENYDEYVYASLPQTLAEGDALYQVYFENFNEYVNALRDARNP